MLSQDLVSKPELENDELSKEILATLQEVFGGEDFSVVDFELSDTYENSNFGNFNIYSVVLEYMNSKFMILDYRAWGGSRIAQMDVIGGESATRELAVINRMKSKHQISTVFALGDMSRSNMKSPKDGPSKHAAGEFLDAVAAEFIVTPTDAGSRVLGATLNNFGSMIPGTGRGKLKSVKSMEEGYSRVKDMILKS